MIIVTDEVLEKLGSVTRVTVDDIWCAVRPIKYPDSPDGVRKRKCVLCHEILNSGDNAVILVNNYEFFPNCIVHKECVGISGRIHRTIKILRRQYNKYKELKREANKHWNSY